MDCGEPPEIPNGHFTLASNVTYYGTAVLYECDPHYEIDGHARRLCLENGTWSSETPTCKGINDFVYFTKFSVLLFINEFSTTNLTLRKQNKLIILYSIT